MYVINGAKAQANVYCETPLEETAVSQIMAFLGSEAVEGSHVAIMPDAHAGAGCVIGTTMTLTDKAVPNLVGVDIGCGMLAVRLSGLTGVSAILSADLAELDAVIRRCVPSGFAVCDKPAKGAMEILEQLSFADGLGEVMDIPRAVRAPGSLGGGNHFIELAKSDNDRAYWLVIHSGSRNPGLTVANHHQDMAKRMRPNAGALAWLEGEELDFYLHDMALMQRFASLNRRIIADAILREMRWEEAEAFETVHNYIDLEDRILRKGAVSAKKGERLLIPFNMRDGSVICEGLGNPDWNFSAPHGAGRAMGRKEAKRKISLKEMRKSMQGVWTSSLRESTVDEAPQAYKDSRDILSAIRDTARVMERLSPVYNFKAS